MLRIEDNGKVRVVSDDMNPRIYYTEIRCTKCGGYTAVDDIDNRWYKDGDVVDSGTPGALPYCRECSPDEED